MTQAVTLSGLGSTNALYTDSSGNVGIGTSSPAFPLDISGPVANIRVAPTTTINNALTRYVNAGGTGYVGLDSSVGGLTTAYALNMYHSGAYPITFSTSGTERARIDSSGNVGIGLAGSTANSKLSVYGPTGIASGSTGEATGVGSIRIENGSSSLASDGGLEFKIAGDSNGYGSKIQALNSGGSQLVFANRNASATWIERMRIDSSGRVTMPYQPGFYSRRSIAGDGRPAGAQEWIVTGTGSYNTGGHFNASNGRFTAPVSGQYVFSAAPGYKQTGIIFSFHYAINGTSISEPIRFIEGSSHSTATGTIVVYLSQGDYLQIFLMGDHHANTTFNFFSGHFLG